VVITGTDQPVGLERLARIRQRFDRVVVVRIGAAGGKTRPAPIPLPTGVTRMDVTSLDELGAMWRGEALR
jgi:hypothetical protein